MDTQNQSVTPVTPSSPRSTILAVDDNPTNLSVISDHLKQCNYRVIVARDGESALERAEYGKPDLILLDVLMPGMDGYETCRQLKANEKLKDIPVIFMTALSETPDKVKAFQSGGVDYITKPFQQEEMLARVATHLELKRKSQDLKASYEQLKQMQQMRDDLVHMIVHDLRSPIWGLNGYLELLTETEPDITEEGRDLLAQMLASSSSLLEMVSSILDVNKMEAGSMKLCVSEFDLETVTRSILQKLTPLSGARTMRLTLSPENTPPRLAADEGLISRLIENLISNAIKFTPEMDGDISIQIDTQEEQVQITVSDNGYGIPEEHREHVFDKFGQAGARQNFKKYSTGLGLPFCKLAAEAHGGHIELLPPPEEGGTIVRVQLPRQGPTLPPSKETTP